MFKFTKYDIIKDFTIVDSTHSRNISFDTFKDLICSYEFQNEFKGSKGSEKFIKEVSKYARKGYGAFEDFIDWCIIWDYEIYTDKRGNITIDIIVDEPKLTTYELEFHIETDPDVANGL